MNPYQQVSQRVKELVTEGEGVVVFDIDETLITGRGYEGRHFFIKQAKAELAPIQEMVDLYNWIQDQGRRTYLITARHPGLKEATITNLKKVGIKGKAPLLMKPRGMDKVQFKTSMRRAIEDRGHVILANIGDQETDLQGGYAMETFLLPSTY